MKRFLRLMLLSAVALAMLFTAACSQSDGAPEGMKLVRGGDGLGYYFYAPEEWVIANQGDIAAVYTSKVDSSSLTFTEAKKPEVSAKEYFHSEMEKLPFEIEMQVDGEKCSFGNAKEAYKFIYTYSYKESSIATMQILVYNSDRFYIFTYTSYTAERTDGESYYQFYLEKVETVIKSFKLVTPTGESAPETPDYPKDDDGFLLVSDRTLAGFDMYVPDDFRVVDSSSIVSVSKENGANVNLTKATYTNVTRDEYWRIRRENLELLADKTEKDGQAVSTLCEIEIAKEVELNGVDWAFSYEYTYSLLGVEYHVYQVLIVDGYDGFVFTYTAKDADYDGALSEALKILEKVKF